MDQPIACQLVSKHPSNSPVHSADWLLAAGHSSSLILVTDIVFTVQLLCGLDCLQWESAAPSCPLTRSDTWWGRGGDPQAAGTLSVFKLKRWTELLKGDSGLTERRRRPAAGERTRVSFLSGSFRWNFGSDVPKMLILTDNQPLTVSRLGAKSKSNLHLCCAILLFLFTFFLFVLSVSPPPPPFFMPALLSSHRVTRRVPACIPPRPPELLPVVSLAFLKEQRKSHRSRSCQCFSLLAEVRHSADVK